MTHYSLKEILNEFKDEDPDSAFPYLFSAYCRHYLVDHDWLRHEGISRKQRGLSLPAVRSAIQCQ